jgi:hypothetical protein
MHVTHRYNPLGHLENGLHVDVRGRSTLLAAEPPENRLTTPGHGTPLPAVGMKLSANHLEQRRVTVPHSHATSQRAPAGARRFHVVGHTVGAHTCRARATLPRHERLAGANVGDRLNADPTRHSEAARSAIRAAAAPRSPRGCRTLEPVMPDQSLRGRRSASGRLSSGLFLRDEINNVWQSGAHARGWAAGARSLDQGDGGFLKVCAEVHPKPLFL